MSAFGMIWRGVFSLLWGVAPEIVPVYRECRDSQVHRGSRLGTCPPRYRDRRSDRR